MSASHPHHHPGHRHPPATLGVSMLRASAWQRVALAAAAIAMIWSATFWALH